jgi:hypothetical protein
MKNKKNEESNIDSNLKRNHKKIKVSHDTVRIEVYYNAYLMEEDNVTYFLVEKGRNQNSVAKYLTTIDHKLTDEDIINDDVVNGEIIPPYLALDVSKLRKIIMNSLDEQLCSDKRIDRNWRGMTLLNVTDREMETAKNKLKISHMMRITSPVLNTDVYPEGEFTFTIIKSDLKESSKVSNPVAGKYATKENLLNYTKDSLYGLELQKLLGKKKLHPCFSHITLFGNFNEVKLALKTIFTYAASEVLKTANEHSTMEELEKE